MEGGRALADILWGDVNPVGKLTISFPVHVGQQPVYYNQLPGWHTDTYCDMPVEPLWVFGDGLSYTSYEYSDLQLAKTTLEKGEAVRGSVKVKNTGDRSGIETVQIYVNDVYSSATTPIKELKGFQRIALEAGEEKTIKFELPFSALSMVNSSCQRVVEPGEFEILVGPTSRCSDLLRGVLVVE